MYEDRILAFIDVLGFSEAIKQTMKDGKENKAQTDRIDSLIRVIQSDLKIDDESYRKHYNFSDKEISVLKGSRVVNQFSDSIVISYLINEESGIFVMLLEILFLCMTALQHDFLLRGAIVRNKLYHSKNEIFGPGLVEAYEMEKSLAIYPRIVLDDDIIKLSRKYYGTQNGPDTEEEFVRSLVKRDFDGMYYINYFDGVESELDNAENDMPLYFNRLRDVIEKLKLYESASVKSKYLWIKEKYNIALKKYKIEFKKSSIKKIFPELAKYYRESKYIR